MKRFNRTHSAILLSSLALLLVLLIQVNWILRTARIKEDLFNEKANIVLTKTAEAMRGDQRLCGSTQHNLGLQQRQRIDSLFHYYLKLYHIPVEYNFEVRPVKNSGDGPQADRFVNRFFPLSQESYTTCLEDESRNPVELKLILPKKEEFILAEMGLPFLSSVVLILIVLVMSWRTMLSLQKEKQISEHTTDFLNNMTHEFKTPLTNIALAGKLLLRENALQQEEKVNQYANLILDENEKLRLQVEQMLSRSALERGENPLKHIPLEAHALIREVAHRMSLPLEQAHARLTMDLQAAKPLVMGDPMHLANAIQNLLDNAIKYSGAQPQIVIRTHNQNNCLQITVSDQGPGIPKEYRHKVFEPYFRIPTGDLHEVKGFGLGLSYVKTIVELLNGSIRLQSDANTGTRFTITLPNV